MSQFKVCARYCALCCAIVKEQIITTVITFNCQTLQNLILHYFNVLLFFVALVAVALVVIPLFNVTLFWYYTFGCSTISMLH